MLSKLVFLASDHDNGSASNITMTDANYTDADHVLVRHVVDHVGGTMNEYASI